MDNVNVSDVIITPLQRIPVPGGDVLHAMKSMEDTYEGFGEAYFSIIEKDVVKGWKKHNRMTLNLVVPCGNIEFVFVDRQGTIREETIGERNYARLTVPPGIWFAFRGLSNSTNLALNIANIPHDAGEVERVDVNDIEYEWR